MIVEECDGVMLSHHNERFGEKKRAPKAPFFAES